MMNRRCALLLLVSSALAADIRVVEEIVAKVNNDVITRTDLARERLRIESELRAQGVNGPGLPKAIQDKERDVLRDKIDQLLLVQRGKDLNISVDAEVTKRIAQIQLRSKISDPDRFHEWIREQSQGMPFEDVRSELRNSILTQRVLGQEVGSKISPPRSEIEKYYQDHKNEFVREEQVFLREILISTEGKTPDQVTAAEKKAKDIVARARKGEKFADLARDYSDNAETAKSGGEMPPYKKGLMWKEIDDVVFTQKKRYVTDPIRLPYGCEILRSKSATKPDRPLSTT